MLDSDWLKISTQNQVNILPQNDVNLVQKNNKMTPYRKLAENGKNLGHYDIQGTPNKSQVFLPFRHFGYIVLCNFSICFYNQFNLGNLVSNDDDKPKRIKLRCILLIELKPTKTQYFTGLTLALANVNIFFLNGLITIIVTKKGSIKMGPSVMRRSVHRLDRALPTLYK